MSKRIHAFEIQKTLVNIAGPESYWFFLKNKKVSCNVSGYIDQIEKNKFHFDSWPRALSLWERRVNYKSKQNNVLIWYIPLRKLFPYLEYFKTLSFSPDRKHKVKLKFWKIKRGNYNKKGFEKILIIFFLLFFKL